MKHSIPMKNIEANLPTKADLVRLIQSIRPQAGFWPSRPEGPISDTIYPTEEAAKEAEEKATGAVPVYVQLTVGWSPETGGWGWQTGDNSYTGGAYGHPVCGVNWVTHDSDPEIVADEILDELGGQAAD